MNNLLILLGLVVVIIILLTFTFKKEEKYTYNAYLAEQRDRMNDESTKFSLFYKRMEKEIKQKI